MPAHLSWLEPESIQILREAVVEARNPVMLFPAGKDSTVMADLALRALYRSKPPFPLLHVDSIWEFRSLIEFRDAFAAKHGFKMIAYAIEEGRAGRANVNIDTTPTPDALSSARASGGVVGGRTAQVREGLAGLPTLQDRHDLAVGEPGLPHAELPPYRENSYMDTALLAKLITHAPLCGRFTAHPDCPDLAESRLCPTSRNLALDRLEGTACYAGTST